MVLGAVLLRLVALASDLGASDDASRVVWEGRVVASGRSPFAFAPDDPELGALAREHAALHAGVNHRDVPAAYPPLIQASGLAVASLALGDERDDGAQAVLWLRAAFAAADLLLLFPLFHLLRRRGLPLALALAWGWCPLVAFEVAGAAHLEGLAVPLTVAALALAERAGARAACGTAVALAAAILAKWMPLVMLPWTARERRSSLHAPAVLALCAAVMAPFLLLDGGDRGFLAGLGEYALRWEGGSLVHRFVEGAFALGLERDLSFTDPRRLARLVAAALWVLWAWRTWRRERDAARAALDLFGAWLLLTPTLHPWYVLWIVPWLALRPSPAFLWLAIAAPLLHAPAVSWQHEGLWREPVWLWPAVAVPFLWLLVRPAVAPRVRRPG